MLGTAKESAVELMGRATTMKSEVVGKAFEAIVDGFCRTVWEIVIDPALAARRGQVLVGALSGLSDLTVGNVGLCRAAKLQGAVNTSESQKE